MLEEEKIFWEHVESFSAPDLTEKDYIQKNDEIWTNHAKSWIEAMNMRKEWEAIEEEAEE